MKIEYDRDGKYLNGGGKAIWDKEYDFLLVRQDFNGFESVYFDIGDIDDIFTMIYEGEIAIHHNYSILYAKDKKTLDIIPESEYEFPCYATVWSKDE